MATVAIKKKNKNGITVAKKLRDYSKEPVFKKKTEKAMSFLKKHGLPKSFSKKKK